MSKRDAAFAKRCLRALNPRDVLMALARQGEDPGALLWYMKANRIKPDEQTWRTAAQGAMLALAKGAVHLGGRAEGLYHVARLLMNRDPRKVPISLASPPGNSVAGPRSALWLLFASSARRLEGDGVQGIFEQCASVLNVAALRVLSAQLARPLAPDTLARAQVLDLPAEEREPYVRLLLDLRAEPCLAYGGNGSPWKVPLRNEHDRETRRRVELARHLINLGTNVNDLGVDWRAAFYTPFFQHLPEWKHALLPLDLLDLGLCFSKDDDLLDLILSAELLRERFVWWFVLDHVLLHVCSDLALVVASYLGPVPAELVLTNLARAALLACAGNRPRRATKLVRY